MCGIWVFVFLNIWQRLNSGSPAKKREKGKEAFWKDNSCKNASEMISKLVEILNMLLKPWKYLAIRHITIQLSYFGSTATIYH